MKKLGLLFILLTAPIFSAEIKKEQLRDLIGSKKEIIIVDARTAEYDNGERLPGAILIPYDASDEELLSKLPHKMSVIVTYCTNYSCTACHYLAQRLQKLGYKNVSEYRGGLAEWKKASYPIQHVNI